MSASPPPVPRDVPEVQPDGRALRNWMNDLLRFLGSSGGTGTVTEVDTVAPITGGPITTTGTIAVSTMTGDSGAGGARGVVPAPAAGDAAAGKFLKADGTWTAPSGGGSGTVTSVGLTVPAEFSVSGSPVTGSGTLAITKANESANKVWAGPTSGSAAQPTFRSLTTADLPSFAADWIFGDGRDGDVVLDGVNTFTWATLAGSTYTLTDAVMANNMTINAGIIVDSGNGYPVFTKATLTCNGTIRRNGISATTATGATSQNLNAWLGSGSVGQGGGNSTGTNGVAGTNAANSLGGAGGSGGTGTAGTAGAGGTSTPPANGSGGIKIHATLPCMLGFQMFKSTTLAAFSAGAGGGGGAGGSINSGGGGGSGGLVVSLICATIDNTATGSIEAKGGNGASIGNANCGGGGGGGGGLIRCITRSTSWRSGALTATVAGGNGGTGGVGGGSGANGSAGSIIELFIT